MTGGIEMKWTKGKKAVAVIAVIATISMICGIGYYGVMRSKYNNVVEMIKQRNYETADEMLIDMNVKGTIDDKKRADFRARAKVRCEHPDAKPAEPYFADSAILYVYISAMEYYNDNKFEYAESRINLVPEDYRGALCEEIKTSQQEINKRYEEYQQEVEKAKEKEESVNTYKERSATESKQNVQKSEQKQSSANSSYYRGYSSSNSVESSSGNRKKSDPYDVYDYDDPEDFYYDNYDDFESYEDAEDYFDDHND